MGEVVAIGGYGFALFLLCSQFSNSASALHYLRLVRIVGEKLKKGKDIFDFACIYDIIYM